MVLMRKTSLVEAKTHLSELVDLAEHRQQRTIILRHGKPAAAIVPVDVAAASKRSPRRPKLTKAELAVFWAQFDGASSGALGVLAAGRSRLDPTEPHR